jgi:integrase
MRRRSAASARSSLVPMCWRVEPPTTTPQKEKRVRAYMHRHEYKELLAQASGNIPNTAMVQLLLQTGMRVSELCGLNRCDVDFRIHRLTVRGKGNKERTLPVPSVALEPLKQYLELRGLDEEEALFVSRFGERLSTRSVQKLVVSLRVKLGFEKKITPHTFRHTYISYHARSGFSAEQLMPLTGHEHSSSTMPYIHDISTEQMMKAVEKNALV